MPTSGSTYAHTPNSPRNVSASRWPTGPTALWKPGPTRSRTSNVLSDRNSSRQNVSRNTAMSARFPVLGALSFCSESCFFRLLMSCRVRTDLSRAFLAAIRDSLDARYPVAGCSCPKQQDCRSGGRGVNFLAGRSCDDGMLPGLMDVRCERCKTEYEFDDARITEAGVT